VAARIAPQSTTASLVAAVAEISETKEIRLNLDIPLATFGIERIWLKRFLG
jgi:hypothetical protein